jgi:hypothetical protein
MTVLLVQPVDTRGACNAKRRSVRSPLRARSAAARGPGALAAVSDGLAEDRVDGLGERAPILRAGNRAGVLWRRPGAAGNREDRGAVVLAANAGHP